MDQLETIFTMQEKLNGFIRESRGLDFSPEQWIQKEMLALLSEMSEVLDEVNFKWWKNPKPLDQRALKEEIVDMLHFLISMAIDAGMTAEEMTQIYLDKNKENFDRQNGLSQKQGYSTKTSE